MLAQCDALDGVTDGLIENPTQCHFDPAPILCKAGGSRRMPHAEAGLVGAALMGPAKTSGKGRIFPGYAPGAEFGWGFLLGSDEPYPNPLEDYNFIVYSNPDWDWRTFQLERDLAGAEKAGAGTLTGVNPDLAPFTKHGGKLLMYHGWSGPADPAARERELLHRAAGQARRNPCGCSWCPAWGIAPAARGRIPSTWWRRSSSGSSRASPGAYCGVALSAGKVDRTRPLCAYPQVARYKGTGDINEAENFVCAK